MPEGLTGQFVLRLKYDPDPFDVKVSIERISELCSEKRGQSIEEHLGGAFEPS